jgi:hypothetical protein
MPALKSPSVIVLDNASYHNIKTEETVVPNFNQREKLSYGLIQIYNFIPILSKLPDFSEVITPIIYY